MCACPPETFTTLGPLARPFGGWGGREHAMTNAIPLLLEDTKAVNNSGKDSSEMISYQVPVNNRH